jgi:hypothetical protein
MLIFKNLVLRSPLPRTNSKTELIFTMNRCCGIDAWNSNKFKNSVSFVWQTDWQLGMGLIKEQDHERKNII